MSVRAGIVRGCGVRQAGGVYACCALSESGLPLEAFIYDPPKPFNATELGLAPVGVQLIEQNGTWHILDWIGEVHYPEVADFLEETRRFGLSRRLARSLDFSLLTPDSRHILIHSRGYIVNWADLYAARDDVISPWHAKREEATDWRCPKQAIVVHPNTPHTILARAVETAEWHHGMGSLGTGHPVTEMCSSLWWESITRNGTGYEATRRASERLIDRQAPSFRYLAHCEPEHVKPEYRVAMIARFPITHLEVIRDPADADAQAKAEDAARHSGLAVSLEDE